MDVVLTSSAPSLAPTKYVGTPGKSNDVVRRENWLQAIPSTDFIRLIRTCLDWYQADSPSANAPLAHWLEGVGFRLRLARLAHQPRHESPMNRRWRIGCRESASGFVWLASLTSFGTNPR